ncbi:MAG: fumarylacetoacetate hydrolase family protein [Clostridiales bacterium]|nr:fumarylacetoacetate hydrolase family protein [Clostridiales bacterium]
MKLMNFKVGDAIHVGLVLEDGVVDLNAAIEAKGLCDRPGVGLTMEKLIAAGDVGRALVQQAAEGSPRLNEADLVYAPAVTCPEKILCVGLNYKDHVDEGSSVLPDFPVLFSKFNTSLAAHEEVIPIPKATGNIDYEAELVVVIGKECFEVSKEQALDYVYGYTIGNDLSARAQQRRVSQWLTGKSPDKFGPVGPYIVTADDIDGGNLEIKLYRNGEVGQQSNTRMMIFDTATIISYTSQFMTLKPGDIIFTGTMAGVIGGHKDPVWLKAGEELVVEIEGIGRLRNVLA